MVTGHLCCHGDMGMSCGAVAKAPLLFCLLKKALCDSLRGRDFNSIARVGLDLLLRKGTNEKTRQQKGRQLSHNLLAPHHILYDANNFLNI